MRKWVFFFFFLHFRNCFVHFPLLPKWPFQKQYVKKQFRECKKQLPVENRGSHNEITMKQFFLIIIMIFLHRRIKNTTNLSIKFVHATKEYNSYKNQNYYFKTFSFPLLHIWVKCFYYWLKSTFIILSIHKSRVRWESVFLDSH